MPPAAKKSPSRMRSKSPGRPKGSRSRSRGRSKSRGRSPGRKAKKSPTPSPARQTKRTTTPKRETKPKQVKSPSTPTRQSARVAAQEKVVEEKVKPVEVVEEKKETERSKRVSVREEKKEQSEPTKKAAASYDFGGPICVFFMIVALPLLVILINLACGKECTLSKLPKIPRDCASYFDRDAALIFLGWLTFQSILALVPVGRVVDGQPLKSGKRLQYRCNGFFALLASLIAFSVAIYLKYPFATLYAKFLQMAVTAIIFSFVLSIAVFIRARNIPESQRAEAGNTGNLIYDFFMGRELNPRIGSFDLKFLSELRPGLIGWVMLNLVFVAVDCQRNNGQPNPALLMVTAFQTWYVAEALWFEESILSTMDITHEGFGFMLAFGDIAWVPFLYCLQGKFLLENPQQWTPYALAGIFTLNLIGYIIFRGSNSQKNKFRTNPYDPSLAHLETLPTASGKRLLVSGWWGLCRHPNYLGDLIMALAWSLPCGFNNALPYFYVVYFLFLLMDRARRDDVQCRRKYGAAWERYCQRVPFQIFPYIY